MPAQRRLIAFLVAAGAALRWPGLFANTFHADEALYASYARQIAVWNDPLLLTRAVDKPPLLFYTQAIFYPFAGPVEWAARLPSFIASLLLIPLTARLAWRLRQRRATAVLAATIVALAPFAIQFAPSAFLDPLLTTLLTAALLAVVERRAAAAGLLFALAAATKYQAWLFLPLLLAVALRRRWPRRRWIRATGAITAVLLTLLAWQLARAGAPSPIAAQWANVGGLALSPLAELPARLATILQLAAPLAGPLWLLAFLWLLWLRRLPRAQLASLLAAFTLAYIALHLLLDLPLWDRYLLPLLPLLAILLAFALTAGPRPFWRVSLATLLLLPGALSAAEGRYPLGARRDADHGAAQIAPYFADAPYGTVLYDHWFSWQWRYHLFDKRVHLNWFVDPAGLAADLAAFGHAPDPRYIVLPKDPVAQPVRQAVNGAGFVLNEVAASTGMTLYKVMPADTGRRLQMANSNWVTLRPGP